VADKILNTGLDALLGDVAAPNKQSIKEIDLTQIKPNRFQPRQSFDEQKITELSQSIAKHGILSPILVRETGAGGFELIAGERRLRAAKQAGLRTAPCMVDTAEDQLSLELALIENLQREDLNPIEEARGYDRLKREFSLTQDKIAEVTGKARSSVANSIRLLNLLVSWKKATLKFLHPWIPKKQLSLHKR
jgi:ParB family chromosome partitioning protein